MTKPRILKWKYAVFSSGFIGVAEVVSVEWALSIGILGNHTNQPSYYSLNNTRSVHIMGMLNHFAPRSRCLYNAGV